MSWLGDLYHLIVPATVNEQERKIVVPSFEIPLDPELPDPWLEPIKGVVAVEVHPESTTATVKVKLKKKARKPASKPTKKKKARR